MVVVEVEVEEVVAVDGGGGGGAEAAGRWWRRWTWTCGKWRRGGGGIVRAPRSSISFNALLLAHLLERTSLPATTPWRTLRAQRVERLAHAFTTRRAQQRREIGAHAGEQNLERRELKRRHVRRAPPAPPPSLILRDRGAAVGAVAAAALVDRHADVAKAAAARRRRGLVRRLRRRRRRRRRRRAQQAAEPGADGAPMAPLSAPSGTTT